MFTFVSLIAILFPNGYIMYDLYKNVQMHSNAHSKRKGRNSGRERGWVRNSISAQRQRPATKVKANAEAKPSQSSTRTTTTTNRINKLQNKISAIRWNKHVADIVPPMMMTASTRETENIEKTPTAVGADETVWVFLFFLSLSLSLYLSLHKTQFNTRITATENRAEYNCALCLSKRPNQMQMHLCIRFKAFSSKAKVWHTYTQPNSQPHHTLTASCYNRKTANYFFPAFLCIPQCQQSRQSENGTNAFEQIITPNRWRERKKHW